MPVRKRDKYTHWSNDCAIDDLHELLSLLEEQWRDTGKRYVHTGDGEPHVQIEWSHDGDSGGFSSGIRYFEAKRELIDQLLEKGLVTKMQVPRMGYTYTEPHKLVLSNLGELELQRLNDEKKRLARSLLIPGEHSKFSGIFNDAGFDREHYKGYGRLYFDFVTPMNEKVRVYPDTKEVRKLEAEKVRT